MRAVRLPCLAVLLGLVVGVIPPPSLNETLLNVPSLAVGDSDGLVRRAPPVAPADDFLWHTCSCRGQKLQLMDTLDPANAARFGTPLNSPWTGTLENELAQWGYKEDSAIDDGMQDPCDFTLRPMFEAVLHALGIGSGSAQHGGPNKCFTYVHRDGPAVHRFPNGLMPATDQQRYTVNGVSYRVTNAYYTIGINAVSGVIHMIDRVSPESAAKSLWGVQTVPKDELPALRSSSDIAWGLWERMSPGNLGNINYIFSHIIINREIRAIIVRAMNGRALAPWPGTEFVAGEDSGYWALLGSPNGIAAGYLLGQHKPQFGHNRYVSSIHVFQGSPVNPFLRTGGLSWLCFVVKPAPVPAPQPPDEVMGGGNALVSGKRDLIDIVSGGEGKHRIVMDEGRLVNRSRDGKNIVRSHEIWTKL